MDSRYGFSELSYDQTQIVEGGFFWLFPIVATIGGVVVDLLLVAVVAGGGFAAGNKVGEIIKGPQ